MIFQGYDPYLPRIKIITFNQYHLGRYLIPALNVYNLVLMRNFFEGIPASLFESATLDGCTPMQTFIRIVLPMSKAALASIGLMFAVTYWNDYTHYKLYITDSNLYNFQMKLRSIIMGSDLPQANGGATENTVKNAAIIVIIIPFMIVYPFLQKYFVKGVNIGAVKNKEEMFCMTTIFWAGDSTVQYNDILTFFRPHRTGDEPVPKAGGAGGEPCQKRQKHKELYR